MQIEGIRLENHEIDVIRGAVKQYDKNAIVYLFGSRADINKKGGDIDLLILSNKLNVRDSGKIRWEIWESIGEQKIDIVIAGNTKDPFVRIALQEGKKL